jgi:hypothetical protein
MDMYIASHLQSIFTNRDCNKSMLNDGDMFEANFDTVFTVPFHAVSFQAFIVHLGLK